MKRLLAFIIIFYCGCATTPPSKSAIQKAEEEYLKGNYSLAISNYQGYLNSNVTSSDASEANYRMGICYFKLNDPNNAILYLERALSMTSDKLKTVAIRYILAEVSFDKGDYVKATQNYEAIYYADPKLLSQVVKKEIVAYNLAISMLRNKRWDDGRSLLRKFIVEFPNSEKVSSAKIIVALNENKFFVQCGVFSNKVNAERDVRELAVKGVKAFTKEMGIGFGGKILVLNSDFSDWQLAQKEVERLKALGITAYTLP